MTNLVVSHTLKVKLMTANWFSFKHIEIFQMNPLLWTSVFSAAVVNKSFFVRGAVLNMIIRKHCPQTPAASGSALKTEIVANMFISSNQQGNFHTGWFIHGWTFWDDAPFFFLLHPSYSQHEKQHTQKEVSGNCFGFCFFVFIYNCCS